MVLTPKQADILRALADYYVLVRRQVQRIVYPSHRSGRKMREQLLQLYRERLIGRSTALVPYLGSPTGSPCYYLKDAGRLAAAEYFEDDRILLASVRPPTDSRLLHWVGISENHYRVRAAIERQEAVRLVRWVNEWCRFQPRPDEPETFVLHYVFREDPPLSVSPDAAMVLELDGVKRAFYWEIDRGTSAIPQVAAAKWHGYQMLAERRLHQTHHFDGVADNFKIIVVTTSPWRRDRLARAFAKYDGAERYLFCAQEDLQPATFLHVPFLVDCEGNQKSIVKPQPAQNDDAA